MMESVLSLHATNIFLNPFLQFFLETLRQCYRDQKSTVACSNLIGGSIQGHDAGAEVKFNTWSQTAQELWCEKR